MGYITGFAQDGITTTDIASFSIWSPNAKDNSYFNAAQGILKATYNLTNPVTNKTMNLVTYLCVPYKSARGKHSGIAYHTGPNTVAYNNFS
jgi:hypothetical protein